MDTIFPDLSEFQPTADMRALRSAGYDAIAVRVCYGSEHLDHRMPTRRDDVRGAGFTAVMWYIFMRPSQPIAAQFNAFVSVIPSLQQGEAVFIDWESDSGATATAVQAIALATLFDNHYGQKTGLYFSSSMQTSGVENGRPVWVAAYGTSEPSRPHTVWQYTDGKYTSGAYKPVDFPRIGVCDTNVFHGTPQQLADIISPHQGVKPMYDPPLVMEPWVASLASPSGGAWGLSASGAVYAVGGAPFFGGAHGKDYFAGRVGATLDPPNGVEAAAGKHYTIVATNSQRYSYPE